MSPGREKAAYNGMVCPILEYERSVWDSRYEDLNDELEKVQKRVARFVTRKYTFEESESK